MCIFWCWTVRYCKGGSEWTHHDGRQEGYFDTSESCLQLPPTRDHECSRLHNQCLFPLRREFSRSHQYASRGRIDSPSQNARLPRTFFPHFSRNYIYTKMLIHVRIHHRTTFIWEWRWQTRGFYQRQSVMTVSLIWELYLRVFQYALYIWRRIHISMTYSLWMWVQ